MKVESNEMFFTLNSLISFRLNIYCSIPCSTSPHPPLLFRAFFGSLYRCLARGARAVFQIYPESVAQRELILGAAMRAGFAGGVVVDYPHRYAKDLVRASL